MDILDLQKFLFEKTPSRLELIGYNPSRPYTPYMVAVYRNHSFELVEHTIGAYLDYAGLTVHFAYSDYDDSLSFSNLNIQADMILLWLDFSRYHIEDIYEFIKQRLEYLRAVFKKNILVAPFNGEKYDFSHDGIYTVDLQTIKNELEKKYTDERLEAFSGTKLSAAALMAISKTLALSYLPALLLPPVKAVVVDLDNTLYQGVLGEDGAAGVILTENHIKLQELLICLSQKGILICAATKNNFDDVKQLFDKRADFPLKWDVFAKVCASWDAKSSMAAEIKTYLNINEDSMIFIDDNIGELIEVMSVFPDIKVIQASRDAGLTHKVLRNFPGIFRFARQPEDSLRKDDIKANEKRQELRQTLSRKEYIKSLNMMITYKINNVQDISRISELSNKTNQFIFSYKRYSAPEIAEYMRDEDIMVVSISLKDRLSDSGLIGACIVKKDAGRAVLEELFISCRALGRGIEEIMILNAIKTALDRLNVPLLKVNFTKGERNLPAELFANNHLARFLDKADGFDYQHNTDLLEVCVEG